MLGNNYKTPPKENREWPVIPEDVYQVAIEDINPGYREYQGKKEEILNFQFVILEEGEFKGQKLFKKVKPVVFDGAKSNRPSYLYQIFKAAMKSEPTEKQINEGLTGHELDELVGKQLRVSVKLSSPTGPQGRVYSNVEGVMAAKVEVELPKLNSKAPTHFERIQEETDSVEAEENDDEANAELDMAKPKNSDLPF